MVMTVPDPQTGKPRPAPKLDPRFFADAATNPYFGSVDVGSGSGGAGSADGSGWLDWSKVSPEFASAMSNAVGGRNGVSGGGGGQSMRDFLAQGGYRLYDQPLDPVGGRGRYLRGIVGPDGNVIGDLQEVQDSNDDTFWKAGLAAAALTGGAVANWAGAGGAAASTGSTLPKTLTLADIGAGTLPEGFSLANVGAAAEGAGTVGAGLKAGAGAASMLGAEAAGAGTMLGTAGSGLAAATLPAATSLGATGLGTAAAAGGGVMDSIISGGKKMIDAMGAKDWIDLAGLGISAVGLSKMTAPQAPDMSGVNDAAQRNAKIAERQQDLAEKTYADSMAIFEQFKPMLMQQAQLSIEAAQKNLGRSDAQWADYEQTWRPIEHKMASMTLDMTNPARVEQEAQRAASDVTGQFDQARTENRRALIAAGASPEKIAALEAAGRVNEAKAVGGVMGDARRAQEGRAMAYLDNASRFSRNMPSTGIQVGSLGSSQGGQAVGTVGAIQAGAATPAASAAPLLQSAVGANQSAGGLWNLSANQQYQADMNEYNATLGALSGAANLWGRYFSPVARGR